MTNPKQGRIHGAGGRNRTDMPLRTGDFESFSWLEVPLSLAPNGKEKERICQGKMTGKMIFCMLAGGGRNCVRFVRAGHNFRTYFNEP